MRPPHVITTAASLLEALDARPLDPPAAAEFDAAIWKERGAEGAVLVTDLSGFTRVTKNRGILHFLAMFRRCQRVCLPILDAHGGVLLKQEADDFIVLFPDVTEALDAAIEMLGAMRRMNDALPEADRVYMCIGIEWGPLIRLDDDAFGDTVNVAFKLGEDVADSNEILVGQAGHARAVAAGYDLATRCTVSAERVATTGHVHLRYHALRLKEENR
ncbi:adenylate/guanylate cyclase domain-containing protein [Myxococcota bacterium]|nr:adenylate/guanylate cyclase domain-containing protein [Myxococcota bacterium]